MIGLFTKYLLLIIIIIPSIPLLAKEANFIGRVAEVNGGVIRSNQSLDYYGELVEGNEIYEGDIVKCGENKGLVEWKGIRLSPFEYISGLDYVHGARPKYTKDETEIIGNIYENPELTNQADCL